jgi:hypothetical protein
MGSSSAFKKNKNRIPTLLLHHFRKGRKEFIQRRQEERGRRVETKTPSTHLLLQNPKKSLLSSQSKTPLPHTHTHTHTLKRDCRIYVLKYVLI